MLEDRETGEVLDFGDPATAASFEARKMLWAKVT